VYNNCPSHELVGLKTTLVPSGEDHKTTLVPSGEDHKTTLVPSGENRKTTLVSSGENHKTTLVPSGENRKTTLVPSGEDHKTTLVPSGKDHKTTLVASGEDHLSLCKRHRADIANEQVAVLFGSVLKYTRNEWGRCENTLEKSGKDLKTTLETGGEDLKYTRNERRRYLVLAQMLRSLIDPTQTETGTSSLKIHSKRVGKT
jgi:hypothetical protein